MKKARSSESLIRTDPAHEPELTPHSRCTTLSAMSSRSIHFLLALSLLVMQWAGLTHRIEHSPLVANASVIHAVSGQSSADGAGHNHDLGSPTCLLLDGCTLADAVCSTSALWADTPNTAQSRIRGQDQFRSTVILAANARAPPSYL